MADLVTLVTILGPALGGVVVLLITLWKMGLIGRRENGNGKDTRCIKKSESSTDTGTLRHKELLERLERLQRYICELHKWHDKEDDDGVKVWYVKASLQRSIDELTKSTRELSDHISTVADELRKLQ